MVGGGEKKVQRKPMASYVKKIRSQIKIEIMNLQSMMTNLLKTAKRVRWSPRVGWT